MAEAEKSQLAWTEIDYQLAGEEVPEVLVGMGELCEADMMTDEEIDRHLDESIQTLRVLRDSGSTKFDRLLASFRTDLDFLLSIDRIDLDDYNLFINNESSDS